VLLRARRNGAPLLHLQEHSAAHRTSLVHCAGPGQRTSVVSWCVGATGRLQARLRPKVSLCPERSVDLRRLLRSLIIQKKNGTDSPAQRPAPPQKGRNKGQKGAKSLAERRGGSNPCLAYESWSSPEESASPLQRSVNRSALNFDYLYKSQSTAENAHRQAAGEP
jgi:hypothetical protein